MEDHNFINNHAFMPFSNANFPNQNPNLPIFGGFTLSDQNHRPNPIQLIQPSSTSSCDHESKKLKPASEISGDSSPPFSEKNKSMVGNKRKRNCERADEEKPKEIIHVRAKRGQATDSHSLAERMRREKINEKLRCLQDLVPGCYKAMGMAVMLDVIINYVQSLQYQIEFLSMKLSAASMYFDFNTAEMEVTENMQRNTSPRGIQEIEKVASEGCGGLSYFNPTWPLY